VTLLADRYAQLRDTDRVRERALFVSILFNLVRGIAKQALIFAMLQFG